MIIPTYFNISPSTQTGEVYGTEFIFTADLPIQYSKFVWNFGDKSEFVYNSATTSHIYNYPGIYTVQLSSWTDLGDVFVEEATIDVDYVYRDAIVFSQLPDSYGAPSVPSTKAFTVSVTSAKINQPLSLVLHSFNSNSVPYNSVPKKWNFITPTWRFTEADGTILNGPLVLKTEPIYNSSNRVIGVKAEKSFYYVDDLATGLDPDKDCPLMLLATLSTERFTYPLESLIYPYASYSNSEVARAVITWQINDALPVKFKITENFLNDVYPIKWTNVPIPVLITLESDVAFQTGTFSLTAESKFAKALSYPRTNELGMANEVVLSLSSNKFPVLSAGVHYKVTDAPLNFKASDEYGNVSSGYIFTTITPLTSFLGDVKIVATGFVNSKEADGFGFPIGYPIQPDVYISHPERNTINRFSVYHAPANCPAIEKYKAQGILVEAAVAYVPTAENTTTFSTTGSNVYAMSFSPIANRLYTADMEQNTISYYVEGLNLARTVNLEKILNKTNIGPSYISVDSKSNIWVSMFDGQAVLKFNADLTYLLSAAPVPSYLLIVEPQVTPEEYLALENSELFEFEDPYEETMGIHPPIVETDREDNVWVCYPDDGKGGLNSRLFKFDKNGQTILQAGQLPRNSFPISLSIDPNNCVWVACKNTNNLLCFSSEGVLLSSVEGLIRPSYIAHDRSANIWILHGYNIISVYNIKTNNITSWRFDSEGNGQLGSADKITEYTERDLNRMYLEEEDEIWGGLATDVYNKVWIIDSKHNKAFTFSPDSVELLTKKDILPSEGPYKRYYFTTNDYNPSVIEVTSEEQNRSAQAGADWTGNRWYQKYGTGKSTSAFVKGESTPIKISSLDNTYTVAKVNNTFNYAEHFKSLALPEILQQNFSLFTFLSAAGGDDNPTKESIGRILYEKIANFVNNKADIETAEVDDLLSMAQQFQIEYKEFGKDFPVAVNNLIDLFSVHKQRLRGIPNLETDIAKNTGKRLTEFDSITANRFYLATDKRVNKNFLVWANPYAGKDIYPVNLFTSETLRNPVSEHYYLFVYNENQLNVDIPYTNNLIDWTSRFTTLSYNISSEKEWYGDGGIVETMFNNLLTKQLYQQ